MAIAHQIVDDPLIALSGLLASRGSFQSLLALGRDPGGKDSIRIGRRVSDELDGDIGAKDNVVVFRH